MGASSYTPDPGYGALFQKLANPPNPLTTVGQDAQAIDAVKQFQAKNALVDVYQQSIDPQTGQVDLGKFNALSRQNPAALYNFGESMRSAGVGVGAQGSGTIEQLGAAQAQLAAQASYMTPLIAKAQNGQVTAADVRQTLHDMPPGLISPTTLANINRQLDDGADPNNVVKGAFFANQQGREILSTAQGPLTAVNQGNQTTFVRPAAPFAPGGVSSPPLPNLPGPEAVTLTVGTQTIPNVPYNVANAITQNPELLKYYYPQQYQQMHPGDPVTIAPAPAPAPAVPPGHYPQPQPPAVPAGRPQQPAPTPAPATSGPAASGPAYKQPPPPAPAEAGGVGLTPQTGYNENVQVPSQKAATTLINVAKDTPNVASLIDDMRAQVNQPGWNPGLGAQAGSTYRQVLDRFGVNATGQTPDAQKMAQASYDEFVKDAKLIEARQLSALGTNPTDARQGLAEGITPGLAQTKEGVLGISATLKGNQDAINRTAAAWEDAKAQGWTDGRHNEWMTQWNKTDSGLGGTGGRFDPRVFWLADTDGGRDGQNQRFVSKIPVGQQAQFVKNLNYAKSQGWVRQNDDGSYAVVNP